MRYQNCLNLTTQPIEELALWPKTVWWPWLHGAEQVWSRRGPYWLSIDSHTVNAAHMVSFAWALHLAVNTITQNKHRHSLIFSYTEQICVNCTNSQRGLKKNHVTWYFFIIYCNLGGWSKWKHHFMWCDVIHCSMLKSLCVYLILIVQVTICHLYVYDHRLWLAKKPSWVSNSKYAAGGAFCF